MTARGRYEYSTLKSQRALTAYRYLKRKQLQPFGFVRQYLYTQTCRQLLMVKQYNKIILPNVSSQCDHNKKRRSEGITLLKGTSLQSA